MRTQSVWNQRPGGLALAALLGIATWGLGGTSLFAADEAIPDAVRAGIEEVLQKQVSDLLLAKDKDGIAYKRGTYSKTFKRVDDSTYQVTYHRDTIEDTLHPKDQLKTERLLLTVKKDAGGKWSVANEEVKDTVTVLNRFFIEASPLWKFDSFNFDREGLKVSATNGALYRIVLQGKPVGFTLFADDLKYSWAPPQDVGFNWYNVSFARLTREHPQDINFTPERLEVFCDPTSWDQVIAPAFKGLDKITGGAPSGGKGGKLAARLDQDTKEGEKNYRENPFLQFVPPPRADRRLWSLRFKRDGPSEHYFTLNYDNYQPWEVRLFATPYSDFGQPLFAYYAEDTRKSGIPAYELERRDDFEARDYELKNLTGAVDVALASPETVSGDITFDMTAKRELQLLPFTVSRVRFPGSDEKESKNPKLLINSIQDGSGNEMTFVKRGGFGGIVVFPKPLQAGTEFRLRLQFENKDSIYNLNPSYSAMDRGGWIPFVRFSDMTQQFDLTIRSPAKFKMLGVGKKVSETKQGNILVTRWVSPSPVSFPTVIFGEYIDDGPRIKATKQDGTEIPVRVYVDTVSASAISAESVHSRDQAEDVGRQIEGGARDIRGKQLQAIAEQAVNSLNLYREIYGIDYPFYKLDLVADPLGSFYGQAPASIVYLGFGVFRGEGTVASDFGGGSGISKFNKDVVAHEVGHQWWGSAINNSNFRNYWFVESLAELSSALYVENVYGKKRYLEKVADWRKVILDADLMTSVQNGYAVWAGDSDGGFSPQANIYNKGPYAFHILRETFGDEKFFAFLKKLAQSLKGQEIVTRDIQRIAEETYGGTMEWFFDQWIRGVGIPQYSMNYTTRKTEDGKWLIQGTLKQRVVVGKKLDEMKGVYYRAVAPFTFVYHDGKQSKSPPFLMEGAEKQFQFKLPQEPAEVKFNAEGQILAQDVLVNRSW